MDAVGYSLAQNFIPYRWREESSFPIEEDYVRSVCHGSLVYCVSRTRVQIFDVTTKTWRNGAPPPPPKSYFPVDAEVRFDIVLYKDSIYWVGGTMDGYKGAFHVYDIKSDKWEQGQNPYVIDAVACEVVGDKLYVISSEGRSLWYGKSFLVYDFLTSTWNPTGDLMDTALGESATCAIGRNIYICGGRKDATNSNYLSSWIWKFDTEQNRVTYQTSLIIGRTNGAAVGLNGELVVLGGENLPVTQLGNGSILQGPNFISKYYDAVSYQDVAYVFNGKKVYSYANRSADHEALMAWLAITE
ncbi:hypothetical protein EEL30_15885 [Brevibacillus laterosporus]|uniref:Attractin/MKLN-like beta-propeller domain-containing protein n=2 Tax=Brevibacillus laterosporus TaxID=1465 RepID=A0A518V9H3_BRELA|nr:hypothetical protein EEL30_15885 [Brevibacillus laterosporus]